jgi:SAM-dependent methyltransferase
MASTSADLSTESAFVDAVRDALDRAGFTEAGVLARLDCGETLVVEPREMPHLRALTASGSPLDTFVRLFLLGIAVDEADARRAVSAGSSGAPEALERWLAGGLLARAGDGIRARLRIVPLHGFRIAFDPPTHGGAAEARPDHVPGLGRASSYLVNATVRRPVERALDLGTGCGGQGLLLSRHAREVIATDVNPRALAVAGFNARLAGVTNLTLRAGGLFDPVSGEEFDLVTMNPPFAITPGARFVYRDGGMAGDGFVERVVREAPAHLRPGGLLEITAQWAHVAGEDWRERLARWCEGSGCDAWVIRLYTQTAATYAANWISETERHDAEGFDARWREWMEAFRAARIEDVSTGLVLLQRAAAPGEGGAFWTSDDVHELDEGAGEAIARGFAARAFLRAADDARLLATPLRVRPEVVLEQRATSVGEGWQGEGAAFVVARGLRMRFETDPRIGQLVGACDGARPLAAVLAGFAGSLGRTADEIAPAVLPIVRGLVERGILEVVEAG